MIINLLSPPCRSLGDLRRLASRAFVVILATLFMSGVMTFAVRGWTRGLTTTMSSDTASAPHALTSQLMACTAERDSLKMVAEELRYNCISWRRPQIVLDALAKILPNDIWVQQVSITGTEIELVGAAASEGEIERLVSSPVLVHNLPSARVVSTRTERTDGRRVFHLSAHAPPFSGCGPREGGVHGTH